MKWPWQITTKFGAIDASHITPHQGIDLAAPLDSPVQAMTGGIVSNVTHDPKGFGNAVWIREPDGYRIVFGHLDKVKVYVGERVHSGDLIGLSGKTGHSTGPHLHVGVMNSNGHWVDPQSYFSPWNWYHIASNRVKLAEGDAVAGRIESIVEHVVTALASDFGNWVMHQIAPIAYFVCAVSFLGIIAGIVKARRWAFYSGLLATIGYQMGWD